MTFKPSKKVHVLKQPLVYAVALFAVFYLVVGAAVALDAYKSRLPIDEYKVAVPYILDKRPSNQPRGSQPSESSDLSGEASSSDSSVEDASE